MLRGHITGRMLGKATVSRPSPCVVRGRVRVKAAPQVAPHFGSTLVQDLIFNGKHIFNCSSMFRGRTSMYEWLCLLSCLQEKQRLSTYQSLSTLWQNGAISWTGVCYMATRIVFNGLISPESMCRVQICDLHSHVNIGVDLGEQVLKTDILLKGILIWTIITSIVLLRNGTIRGHFLVSQGKTWWITC